VLFPRLLSYLLLLALPAGLTGCGSGKDQKARVAIHAAGFAYSVSDFLRAAREGKEDIVRQFLTAGMNPNAADEHGATAVAVAAAGGHGHVVTLLLSMGAKPNAASPEGQTALMAAAQSGDLQAVKALLAAGADAGAKDSAGMSPLAAAVLAGQSEVTGLLAERAAAALDDALQLASVKGHTAVMSVLMDRGASPLAVSKDGRTPIMYAAEYGHMEAVKLLRQRGAPVTALDGNLKTPATYAEENGHDDLAAYLREPDRSADPIGLETAPVRITNATFSGDPPASLTALASSMTMVDYRARTLPLMLLDVPEGDSNASVKLLSGESRMLNVAPGQEIPETGLSVDQVKRRLISSKRGLGRLIDASEVLLTEVATGQRILAVKGLPVMSGEACGFAKLSGSDAIIELRRGDEFHPGTLPVKVAEIKPLRIVLERTDTKETATIARSSAE
jgi:ankyrin repeat protein